MNHRSNAQFGFSIIELLISIAILGIIFVVANELLVSSFNNTRIVNSQTSIQEELRSAAALMNDEIQRAYYVFPPQDGVIKTNGADVAVNWSSFTLGSSNMKTGIHGSGTFVVKSTTSGTNPPVLAMITAPKVPSAPCLAKTNGDLYENSALGISKGDGCYQFIAYYGVARVNVTRGANGNSTTSSELLDADSGNIGRMVIMEFRMNLVAKIATSPQVDWGEVGCQLRFIVADKCLTPATTADPISSSQILSNSIPALSCIQFCDTSTPTKLPSNTEAVRFATRMKGTVDWINANASTIPTAILVDYVNESVASGNEGFKVSYTADTFDARGVFQVRLRLQGKISNNGKITTSRVKLLALSSIMCIILTNITPKSRVKTKLERIKHMGLRRSTP
jgi:prepilin-type N-terminal cleavage/methylation domain-containing protein